MKIAVIGGGVSGIRAALTLARAGHAVTLIEKNKYLGGRAFSFTAPEFGEVDIGHHVWLKCCTALEQLIRDMKVPSEWVYRQSDFSILYRRPGKPPYRLQSAPLPWLLHLLPGLLRFPGLGMADIRALLMGMARARAYSPQSLEKLDTMAFQAWLDQNGQTQATVARLWEPLVLAVCNQRAADVSARHALFTFRESLLKAKHAADICFFRRPLSEVFDRHTRKVLSGYRTELCLGALVTKVHPGQPVEVRVQRSGGNESLTFDRVILAMPMRRSAQLLGEASNRITAPEDTAIAGLLLKVARPVTTDLFFAALECNVQWVFNKTAVWTGRNADENGHQLLEVIISGAGREAQLGGKAVLAELKGTLARLMPRLNHVPVVGWRFLQHGSATFAVSPGGEMNRLGAGGLSLPGVALAGDGAATGWPSTMESGVRAGQLAAEHILSQSR